MNKKIRLPNGEFRTVKLVESNPLEVRRARPDEIWTCEDGRQLLPKDMESRHIVNVMRVLEARAAREHKHRICGNTMNLAGIDMPLANGIGILYPIYNLLAAELKRRITGEQPANQPARKFDFDL